MKLILGSQSEARQKVLQDAGLTFTVVPANIDEKQIRDDNLETLPLLVARAKADALVQRITEPLLLITADTVAVFDGQLREKPESAEQAEQYLADYVPNKPVQTNTGVVVTNTQTGKRVEGFDSAAAYFRPIPHDIIKQLVATGRPFKWAGGFAIDDPLLKPYVDKIEGKYQSIYGLPLELTMQLLEQAQTP